MSSLVQIQTEFMALLTKQPNHLASLILAANDEERQQRLSIYLNYYQQRLTQALKQNLPLLASAMDAQQFQNLALDFLQKHPSTSYAIQEFGMQLPQYLRARGHEHLAEIARIDTALNEIGRAPEQELCSLELAQHVLATSRQLTLQLAKCCQLAQFKYNTLDLWQEHGLEVSALQPLSDVVYAIFWRQTVHNYYRQISRVEFQLLQRMVQPISFAELLEYVQAVVAEATPKLAITYLQQWLHNGLLVRLETFEN